MENFIHRNTDGALNPYSKVYDLREVEREDLVAALERVATLKPGNGLDESVELVERAFTGGKPALFTRSAS